MNHIYFEGTDGCGKTTIRKEFAKQSGQKYVTFDRSVISNFVYNIKYGRELFNIYRVLESYNIANYKSYFILLDTLPAIACDRIAKRGESVTESTEYELTEDRQSFLTTMNFITLERWKNLEFVILNNDNARIIDFIVKRLILFINCLETTDKETIENFTYDTSYKRKGNLWLI